MLIHPTPLQNKLALKQMPYLGKKTVPTALRKDLWTPFCVLSFPRALQGLDAFQKLREFKHLHEVAYPRSAILQPADSRKAGQLLPTPQRGRTLLDQRANAVADMAAVLALQARPPARREVERAARLVWKGGKQAARAKRGLGSKVTAAVLEFQGVADRVAVWWVEMRDAEFAQAWPPVVKHGRLALKRGQLIWPPPEGWAIEEVRVEAKDEADGAAAKIGKTFQSALSWVRGRVTGKEKEVPEASDDGELVYESIPETIKWYQDDVEKGIRDKIREALDRATAEPPTDLARVEDDKGSAVEQIALQSSAEALESSEQAVSSRSDAEAADLPEESEASPKEPKQRDKFI